MPYCEGIKYEKYCVVVFFFFGNHTNYPKNSKSLHFYSNNCNFLQMEQFVAMHPQDGEGLVNSVDSDQTAYLEQSDLCLKCLLRPVLRSFTI